MLEAHLDATSSGIAPFAEGVAHELRFSRMMWWFRRAGMDEVTARTFAGDVSAPLSDEIRDALIALIGVRWVNAFGGRWEPRAGFEVVDGGLWGGNAPYHTPLRPAVR